MKHSGLAVVLTAALWAASTSTASALATDGVAANVPQFTKAAALLGPADPSQQIHLVVHLAYPNPAAVDNFAQNVNDDASPMYGMYLTPDQFAANFAPSAATYSAVQSILAAAGMQIVHTYGNRKAIDVVATVAQANAAFGTMINRYSYNNVTYFANSIPALVPNALRGVIMAVSGFDNFARKYPPTPHVRNPLTTPFGYGPLDIQTAYNEPIHVNPRLNGTGVTVAIITSYDYLDSDLQGYWSTYNVKRTGYVFRVFVDDPVPQGVPLIGQSDETTLDVQQTSSNAPGANVLVYEGPDPLNSTFDDNYLRTIQDPRVDVITTSWGSCEAGSDPNEVAADSDIFKQGAAQGITIFAAAGDNGSRDCGLNNPPDGLPGQPDPINIDFPSSSPYVTSSGGTNLVLNKNRTIKSETAWSGGGGGFSMFFPLPFYQIYVPTLANRTWRNAPDVSLDADPNTPYSLYYVNSWALAVGGTSVVAPNLAAIYAQIAQYYNHRMGLAQTGLYAPFKRGTYPGTAFHDIVSGSNGDYNAQPGFDNATGVGSLNGYAYMLQIPAMRGTTRL